MTNELRWRNRPFNNRIVAVAFTEHAVYRILRNDSGKYEPYTIHPRNRYAYIDSDRDYPTVEAAMADAQLSHDADPRPFDTVIRQWD